MKRILTILLIVILLAGCLCACNFHIDDYNVALMANWGFCLPARANCRELYKDDTGPSFTGDGIRYHVYSCENGDLLESFFAWTNESKTLHYDTWEEAASRWLDELQVPEMWQLDFTTNEFVHLYDYGQDNSELLVIWNDSEYELYILEYFI